MLRQRPGEFLQRLRTCISRYGLEAERAFAEVVPELTTGQLLKIQGFLETVNRREYRLFPPKQG